MKFKLPFKLLFKLPFFKKKPLTQTEPLTEAELLQKDKRKLDDFEKDIYIENNMLVIIFGTEIYYFNKHTVLQWEMFLRKINNKYCVMREIDGAYKYVVSYDFYNIENAKEYVKKLTALIQK